MQIEISVSLRTLHIPAQEQLLLEVTRKLLRVVDFYTFSIPSLSINGSRLVLNKSKPNNLSIEQRSQQEH